MAKAITLNDQPGEEAQELADQRARGPDPVPVPWVAEANRFACPVGGPGAGSIVLKKSRLDQIDLTDALTLYMRDSEGNEVTFGDLRAVGNPPCLVPEADDPIFLVRLADTRVDALAATGARYQWRYHPTDPRANARTTGASSWKDVITALWPDGPLLTFPGLPDKVPTPAAAVVERLDLHAVRQWDALEDALAAIGCGLAYDPIDRSAKPVYFPAGPDKALDVFKRYVGRLVWDESPYTPPKAGPVPKTVVVLFPAWMGGRDDRDPQKVYALAVDRPATGLTFAPGTELTNHVVYLQDFTPARLRADGAVRNRPLLSLRAQQVARIFFDRFGATAPQWPVNRAYRGLIDDPDVRPGASFDLVCWSVTGEEPFTLVMRSGLTAVAELYKAPALAGVLSAADLAGLQPVVTAAGVPRRAGGSPPELDRERLAWGHGHHPEDAVSIAGAGLGPVLRRGTSLRQGEWQSIGTGGRVNERARLWRNWDDPPTPDDMTRMVKVTGSAVVVALDGGDGTTACDCFGQVQTATDNGDGTWTWAFVNVTCGIVGSMSDPSKGDFGRCAASVPCPTGTVTVTAATGTYPTTPSYWADLGTQCRPPAAGTVVWPAVVLRQDGPPAEWPAEEVCYLQPANPGDGLATDRVYLAHAGPHVAAGTAGEGDNFAQGRCVGQVQSATDLGGGNWTWVFGNLACAEAGSLNPATGDYTPAKADTPCPGGPVSVTAPAGSYSTVVGQWGELATACRGGGRLRVWGTDPDQGAGGACQPCGWLRDRQALIDGNRILKVTFSGNTTPLGRCACFPGQGGGTTPLIAVYDPGVDAWVSWFNEQTCCSCGSMAINITGQPIDPLTGDLSPIITATLAINHGCDGSDTYTYDLVYECCTDDCATFTGYGPKNCNETMPAAGWPCDNTFKVKVCCSPCDVEGVNCAVCQEQCAPPYFQINVNTFTGSCTDYNGDWYLQPDPEVACLWSVKCGNVLITLTLTVVAGEATATAVFSGGACGTLTYVYANSPAMDGNPYPTFLCFGEHGPNSLSSLQLQGSHYGAATSVTATPLYCTPCGCCDVTKDLTFNLSFSGAGVLNNCGVPSISLSGTMTHIGLDGLGGYPNLPAPGHAVDAWVGPAGAAPSDVYFAYWCDPTTGFSTFFVDYTHYFPFPCSDAVLASGTTTNDPAGANYPMTVTCSGGTLTFAANLTYQAGGAGGSVTFTLSGSSA